MHCGVETDIHGTLRLGPRDPPGSNKRFRNGGNARRLIVELDVVADQRPLNQRRVDPVDPGPTLRGVHRTGAPEDEDRGPITEGVEDGHARVLEPDDVVRDGRHRTARGLRVTVRDAHRDLLVGAEDDLRRPVAAVVHERIVEAPERRTRVEGDVLDARRAHQVHHEIGTILRRRHFGVLESNGGANLTREVRGRSSHGRSYRKYCNTRAVRFTNATVPSKQTGRG